jgi:hypothetical protein
MTALARARRNCKQQTCPLVTVSAPHQQTRNCLTVIKIWSWAPDGALTPRQTGRLTVRRIITLTLTLTLNLTSCCCAVKIPMDVSGSHMGRGYVITCVVLTDPSCKGPARYAHRSRNSTCV